MSQLLLNSLEIQNFRTFRHLHIERLGRVNLVVGKNNVGKTSLLEALYLYARQGAFAAIWDVLEARGEGVRPSSDLTHSLNTINNQATAIAQLFYGRKSLEQKPEPIQIGAALTDPAAITLADAWQETPGVAVAPPILIGISVRRGSEAQLTYTFHQAALWLREPPKDRTCHYVTTASLHTDQISTLWNTTTLTDREADVIRALQMIDATVERVNLLTEHTHPVVVKLADSAEPVRLRSLGEGMNRLFAIVLALVNCKNGLLLLDEIENGLHYSVQSQIWQLIFQLAQRLNVQVFATTHSSDCVRAFQRIAKDHREEGMLIRLGRKHGVIVPSLYDEDLLRMAVEQDVEVR